jgi:hypothetical protein
LRRTIHKIYTFVEAQQEGNRFKILLRHSEMNTLLKDCDAGMQQALQSFKARIRVFKLPSSIEHPEYLGRIWGLHFR